MEMVVEVCGRVKDDVVAQYIKSKPDMHVTMYAVDSQGR